MRSRSAIGACLLVCLLARPALGQGVRAQLEVEFVPTDRAQIAIWVEDGDGQYLKTLALTRSVATLGIGNRPGASHMNSGYRWPYGRRENVLPIWGYARAEAPGAELFKRVIFQDRTSEGHASRNTADHSVDSYYCLSFERELSDKDALDATTCASVFSSDKGRFITDEDVAGGYAEPIVAQDGSTKERSLDRWSLYPPRRDLHDCTGETPCNDHPDVLEFAEHALEVMPNLDAVSRATPAGDKRQSWRFDIPNDWPLDGEYTLKIEVNVEGDYNAQYNDDHYPGPSGGGDHWDTWAVTYGYPYRGQPSLVYSLPLDLERSDYVRVTEPSGYGDVNGFTEKMLSMDGSITDDPDRAPGSGADRLLQGDRSYRARARVLILNPCAGPEPDPSCGAECQADADCDAEGLRCEDGQCVSSCEGSKPPPAVKNLRVEPHPNPQRAHMWATLRFEVPDSESPIGEYTVRVDDGFTVSDARTPDEDQPLMPVAMDVCADEGGQNPCLSMQPGHEVEVVVAELAPQTDYTFEVEAADGVCGAPGETARVDYTSPPIEFKTVSPCFVATAAYGSPLEHQVGVLRRVRDRYLMGHAPGRALVEAYYAHGRGWADWLRESPRAMQAVRAVLDPLVALADLWLGPDVTEE